MTAYGMIASGIGYLPAGDGKYMQLNDCVTVEIMKEAIQHRSMYTMEEYIIEQTITVKARDVQIIDQIPCITGELTSDLSDFSNLDLLEELQERLKNT